MPNTVTVNAWDDIVAEEVGDGILRQTIHGERQTLVRYRYAPGADFPIHAHPEEQITVVLAGRITFTIDGQPITLGPGQIATIPAGVPHGAHVFETEQVDTLNMLSPRRTSAPSIEPKDPS